MHGDAVSDSGAAGLRAGFWREAGEGGGAKQDKNRATKLRHEQNLVDSAAQGQKIACPWNWTLENRKRSGYESAVNLLPLSGAKRARLFSRDAESRVSGRNVQADLSLSGAAATM
jgi:hypothetical protein